MHLNYEHVDKPSLARRELPVSPTTSVLGYECFLSESELANDPLRLLMVESMDQSLGMKLIYSVQRTG